VQGAEQKFYDTVSSADVTSVGYCDFVVHYIRIAIRQFVFPFFILYPVAENLSSLQLLLVNPLIAMRASSSGTGPVETLDNFYVLLAENGDECLELPWYRTCAAFRDGLRRFRSELALPGLRLESIDGKKYFIPEARFTGMAENKPVCHYLPTFCH